MTVDALDWTKFADRNEIPEWISSAYSDSYQGPHEDTYTASAAESIPTPLVTPALLKSHYRLGSHRPAGESRVAVYPPDDASGFGPALQVVTDDGAMLMDSVTVLLHRLGVAYA
ncbi:MAG: NAD-specific glutamate dehydrogenase, partial [Mycobacterium sp.]|nr:NAD-specific glutamate dehydrogenase [Mycobacterium sp.]